MQPVWEWFSSVLTIVRAESTFGHLIPATYGQKDFLKFIGDFLRFADTGIESLQADSEPFRRELLLAKGLDSDELAKAEQRLQSLGPGSGLLITHGWVPMGIIRDEAKKLWLLHLKARHVKPDGSAVDFPLEWESEGTQRLIHLLPTLFQMKYGPTVLVVDELDRRLHTLLTRKFIELAVNDPADDMRQLVFTTHDTNLLDSWLLRRDEIWFAQKNSGVTQLTSLAEYKIRSDLDYEKAYLLGRFEGKPYFQYSPDDGGPHANRVELEAVA